MKEMLARYTTHLVLNLEKRQVLVHAGCLDLSSTHTINLVDGMETLLFACMMAC